MLLEGIKKLSAKLAAVSVDTRKATSNDNDRDAGGVADKEVDGHNKPQVCCRYTIIMWRSRYAWLLHRMMALRMQKTTGLWMTKRMKEMLMPQIPGEKKNKKRRYQNSPYLEIYSWSCCAEFFWVVMCIIVTFSEQGLFDCCFFSVNALLVLSSSIVFTGQWIIKYCPFFPNTVLYFPKLPFHFNRFSSIWIKPWSVELKPSAV